MDVFGAVLENSICAVARDSAQRPTSRSGWRAAMMLAARASFLPRKWTWIWEGIVKKRYGLDFPWAEIVQLADLERRTCMAGRLLAGQCTRWVPGESHRSRQGEEDVRLGHRNGGQGESQIAGKAMKKWHILFKLPPKRMLKSRCVVGRSYSADLLTNLPTRGCPYSATTGWTTSILLIAQ